MVELLFAVFGLIGVLSVGDMGQREGAKELALAVDQGYMTEALLQYELRQGMRESSISGLIACISLMAGDLPSMSNATMLMRFLSIGKTIFGSLPRAHTSYELLQWSRRGDFDIDDFYAVAAAKQRLAAVVYGSLEVLAISFACAVCSNGTNNRFLFRLQSF